MPTFTDQSHLDQASLFKDEANENYKNKNYGKAIRLYHQSLLHARAVQQLSQSGLQGLARFERLQHEQSKDIKDSNDDTATIDKVQEDEGKIRMKPNRTTDERHRMNSTSRGEEMKDEANDVILRCYNNLAACILNGPNRGSEDFLRAVKYCDKVLILDNDNEKALFRKGLCLTRANMHGKAIDVFKLCTNNKEAQNQILICEQVLMSDRKKRDDEIRRNFARAQARENTRNLQQVGQNGHAAEAAVPVEVQDEAPMANGEVQTKEHLANV